MINVAMDGPVGAGKSTVARECAARLGFIYVDTGALYRACGLFCIRGGIDITPENEGKVSAALGSGLKLRIAVEDGVQHVYINDEDVSGEIRMPRISMAASRISALPSVREYLLDTQRSIARINSCIMDGRDIGTVILPDAQVKIFITASPEIRARRRYDELVSKGVDVTFENVLSELNERDKNDMTRESAPLKQAEDAVLLDTSELDFEQTVRKVIEIISNKTGISV